MNKKILSAMLSVAMLFAAGSAFVSCKDYDDDIKNLQGQIDNLNQAVKDIQAQIQKGYLLTDVNQTSGGVTITLSNGKTYEITNGKDGAAGKDGDAWTIEKVGDEYFWFKNGVNQNIPAQGPKGDKGETGATGATGPQGPAGASGGVDGKDGKYYVPNEDGYFWIYDPNTGTSQKSDIKWSNNGGAGNPVVNAAWDSNSNLLILSGLVDSNGNVTSVTISLNGELRGLVFKPYYMFDGIETIIYPWVEDTIMKQPATHNAFQNRQNKTIQYHNLILSIADGTAANVVALGNHVVDWYGNYLKKPADMSAERRDAHPYIVPSTTYQFGLVEEVDYHMNPANSVFAWETGKQGWSVLQPEVINYHTYTRAAAASSFLAPKDNSFKVGDNTYAGFKKFKTENGIMTSLLQITDPKSLNREPTLDTFNDAGAYANNNTVAFWAESGDAGKVTSDYALIYPERIEIEGLIWSQVGKVARVGLTNHGNTDANARWEDNTLYGNAFVENGQTVTGSNHDGHDAKYTSTNPRRGDLLGFYDVCTSTTPIHVWDTPDGALKDPDGAALELYYNDDNGITLRDYLAIHAVKDQVNRATGVDANGHLIYPKQLFTLYAKDYEEENYGLFYEFKLVDYTVDNNVTRDSRYAEIKDSHDGKIVAWNVDYTQVADGKTYRKHNTAAVDREPLVQVLVKNANGQVVLDGYILLHITNQIPPIQPNKDVVYPEGATFTFNLCDAGSVLTTNWDQFSKIVLTDTLKGMTKENFDEIYTPDLTGVTDGQWKELKQWDYAWTDLSVGNKAANGNLGQIWERANTEGNTNHVYKWTLSEEELEALTHHKEAKDLPVTITRWIRYQIDYTNGNYAAAKAPYPYIYIKLTAKVTRDGISEHRFEKINNYWYGLTGDPAKWDAAIFDVREPIDNGNIQEFNRSIRSTLKGNTENIAATHKYYFVAKDVEVTDEYTGVTYVITTNHPDQPNYDKLYCKYVPGDIHTYGSVDVLDEDAMYRLMDKCAIDYGNIYDATGALATATTRPEGMFDNDKIYAKVKGSAGNPTLIATLNQTTGMITQEKNGMNKAVLNAVGYADDNANVDKQQRAWVGIIATTKCNIADKVFDLETQRNKGQFLVSWERPINLGVSGDNVIDAKTNANYKYLVDLLKLFDWRGLTYDVNHNLVPEDQRYDNNSTATNGHMWNNQQWFWAYYNVKSIMVDVRYANVMTNMHQSDPNTFVKLSTITTDAILAAGSGTTKNENAFVTVNFSDITGYPAAFDMASKNAQLLQEMGLNPKDDNKKAKWGFIYYSNNGDNVTNFDLKIPVTIEYEWGSFTRVIDLHVGTTQGNGE